MLRYSEQIQLLGPDAFERIKTAKILMVGAGGIGCELLKNLVMTGFLNIHIVCLHSGSLLSLTIQVDLDTIDLSNLNRQFLFQKKHIKKSKAEVFEITSEVVI